MSFASVATPGNEIRFRLETSAVAGPLADATDTVVTACVPVSAINAIATRAERVLRRMSLDFATPTRGE